MPIEETTVEVPAINIVMKNEDAEAMYHELNVLMNDDTDWEWKHPRLYELKNDIHDLIMRRRI
jgi:hypothetical protein